MSESPKIKVIKAGRLIDGHADEAIKDAVIVIEDRRVRSIERGDYAVPEGSEVIDAGRFTVLPGLFDCHLHLASINACSFANYRVGLFEITPQLQEFYALYHAQRCFEMGFTTLRDMGRETPYGDFTAEICAVRDAINLGLVPGPRILACGRVVTTGSHHDLNLPRSAPRLPGATVTGPWAVREKVREFVRHGCDVIKACVSGGSHAHDDPDSRNLTQEELDAIVDEAHAFGKPCAAHCWTPQSHRMCLKAGVDTIEHIVFTDDATIRLIKEAGVPVTPTLAHRTDHAIEIRRRMGTSPSVLRKMKQVQPHCFDSFVKMHEAGIRMAMGTDTTMDPVMGENAAELELYVQHGMTAMESIKTATSHAADALGLGGELGTLEAGKLADLVIVDGDPLRDIRVLQSKADIRAVMKEGRFFVDTISPERTYLIHPEPEAITIIDAV